MAYQYFESQVIDIIDETDVVKRYFIKVSDDLEFRFKAGQFVMLDLPIESKVTNRSYSIASSPSSDNVFELIIVLKPDGLGTPYLFEKVKTGSKLMVSKPLGKFQLPPEITHDICFVCTGTGIAPFRSQLNYILENKIPHQKLFLVFGNRWVKDVLYHDEFMELEKKLAGFEFHPVLSRENHDTWKGHQGYVHPVYEKLFEDKRPAHFYLCGWADMLKESRQRIEEMGYDRKSIHFESYD